MKIYKEENLSGFEFWSGAKTNAEKLTDEELDQIESTLEELYPDGMDETQINDLFWFEFETVLDWIGKEECPDCGEIFESGETCECQEEEEEDEDEKEEDMEKLIQRGDLALFKNIKNNKVFYTVNLLFPNNKILFTSINFDSAEGFILNY